MGLDSVDARTECMYHAALFYDRVIRPCDRSSDDQLADLLGRYGSLEAVSKAKNLLSGASFKDLESQIGDASFGVLRICDDAYPSHLKSVKSPPPVLYYRGDLSLLERKSVAVVGTREPDPSDEVEGRAITIMMAEKGYVIVSGLAFGCDALAHQTALDYKGSTIAVLGTPIDDISPKKNLKLGENIAENHLLISQYPIGMPFSMQIIKSRFAYRNKTTVGLASEGVVVVKAGDKGFDPKTKKYRTSGTLNAVDECIEQGKVLYVLMANISKRYDWISSSIEKVKELHGEDWKKFFIVPNKPGNGS